VKLLSKPKPARVVEKLRTSPPRGSKKLAELLREIVAWIASVLRASSVASSSVVLVSEAKGPNDTV
jgi:hypothetical protein